MAELPKTLTQGYINERVRTLSTMNDHATAKFVEMWGAEHHQKTVRWFEQAASECKAK